MKFIFLDIDGVLATGDWMVRLPEMHHPSMEQLLLNHLDPRACRILQHVCDFFGDVGLVITSTWRQVLPLPVLREVFQTKGVITPIVGRTPCLSHNKANLARGLEIQWWLQHFLGDEGTCKAHFAILDDDHHEMGDLRGKMVQTRKVFGLTDLEGDYLCKHLRESLMVSMAAGGCGRVLFTQDTKDLEPWWDNQTGPFGPEKEL